MSSATISRFTIKKPLPSNMYEILHEIHRAPRPENENEKNKKTTNDTDRYDRQARGERREARGETEETRAKGAHHDVVEFGIGELERLFGGFNVKGHHPRIGSLHQILCAARRRWASARERERGYGHVIGDERRGEMRSDVR
jgi:hypothetical protein